MSDGNGSTPKGGSGGKSIHIPERGPSGFTPRQERILARRAIKARLRMSGAGERASRSLGRAIELIEKGLESDEVSLTEARRTADCLANLTESAIPKDPVEEQAQENHLHIHAELTPDAMEEALNHMRDARKGPRLHDGNGNS